MNVKVCITLFIENLILLFFILHMFNLNFRKWKDNIILVETSMKEIRIMTTISYFKKYKIFLGKCWRTRKHYFLPLQGKHRFNISYYSLKHRRHFMLLCLQYRGHPPVFAFATSPANFLTTLYPLGFCIFLPQYYLPSQSDIKAQL
jgi:hypothetical protein